MNQRAHDSTVHDGLYETLSAGVSGAAERVIVGLNWTLVVGSRGAGMAQTPTRGTAGCRSLPAAGSYAGQSLAALVGLWSSDNVFEHTIAVAAVNAFWNRYDVEAGAENGLDLIENRGDRAVVIGRFPGVADRCPGVAVVEREPRPGEHSEAEMPRLLERAEIVVITASTIVNGSLPGILALCRHAFVVVVGPSTPLAPGLFDLGVDVLSGFVARDIDGLARSVSEGGAVSALKRFGRYATIRRTLPAPI